MKTSIIILTRNNLSITQKCLESIRNKTKEDYELILVDNGSTDETLDYLHSQQDIKVISNQENKGFAKGCNQGLAIATGETIVFLNNDTVVTENWLTSMLKILYSDACIGMVGPVSNNVSGYQQIPVTYENLNQLDDFARKNAEQNYGCWRRVFRLVGFCLTVKREVLDNIGTFDEQFGFGNYEDDDLCLRAVNKNYQLRIVLDSFVHHIGQATFNSAPEADFHTQMEINRKKIINKWGFDIAYYLHNLRADISVSLCMIVKNEEKVIERCLESALGIADEIIVVDTGSTDRTKEIVSKYTDKSYDFTWIDDFAAARNFSFQQATMEYILWLDADDVISEKDRKKFFELKKTLDYQTDAVNMVYNLSFDSQGNPTFSIRRNRLVKRCRQFQWFGAVHEYLGVSGVIINSDIGILHKGDSNPDTDRNLKIYENRLLRGEVFNPRDLYYYANELLDHRQHEKAILYYQEFLDGNMGWVEDNISACSKMADCYLHLEDKEKARKILLKSFEYDLPRAEFCCRLGYLELERERFKEAVFWYKLATTLERKESWGPNHHAYWTWLPHLQLCVCYDRLKQHELAYKHNEKARKFLPDDSRILYNKKYLENILGLDPLVPGLGKAISLDI